MNVPAWVSVTTRTQTVFRCRVCRARLIPGQYARPEYGEQVLADWLGRHRHDTTHPTYDDPAEPP